MSTRKTGTTGGKPSPVTVAILAVAGEQPGIGRDKLIELALKRAPGATTEQAISAIKESEKTAARKKMRTEMLQHMDEAAIKQIDLAANDTSALTVALTESMAAGDWRLFFLQRDRIEKLDAKERDKLESRLKQIDPTGKEEATQMEIGRAHV